MIVIIGMYMVLAITFIVAKYAVLHVQPVFFIAMRMLGSGIILCGYQYMRQLPYQWPKKVDYHLFVFGMIIHIYIPYVTEFIALQCVTPAKTALFYNLSPFITALVAYYFHRDTITKTQILGMGIGFLGFIPLLYAHEDFCGEWSILGGISYAEILLLISVVSSVFGWMIMRTLVSKGYSPITVNGITMLGGGFGALCTSPLFGEWHDALPFTSIQGLFTWVALGIFLGIACYNWYGHLLKRYSATLLSFAGFTCPLFTALLQVFFFNEGVPIQFFITMACVTVGLYIFYKDELKKTIQKERVY